MDTIKARRSGKWKRNGMLVCGLKWERNSESKPGFSCKVGGSFSFVFYFSVWHVEKEKRQGFGLSDGPFRLPSSLDKIRFLDRRWCITSLIEIE